MTVSDAGGMRVVVRRVDADRAALGQLAKAMRALLDRGYAISLVRSAADGAQGKDASVPLQESSADLSVMLETLDQAREQRGLPSPGGWKPWFPVIDYQRCTNCMQCLSFCLFDVYGVSQEGKIRVQNQSNCKTECPACSRVCPEVAIMFPKYRHGPINGEEVSADDVRREAMKVDISALLGGDIYSMLRDRSAKAKSRFSKERDDERALKERQTCLVKLRDALDVPPEVLAALPTLDEIRAKAEAALTRARAASTEGFGEPRPGSTERSRASGGAAL